MQAVSIVIPAHNEELQIGQTIATIKNQDFAGEVEIVVVDNASTDKTAEVAAAAGARVINEPHKGTRYAYDAGIRNAKHELILVTNADTTLPPNWVSRIVAEYNDPEVVGVGTRVKFRNSAPWVNFMLDLLNNKLNPKRAMWGASLSCRRWAFNKVGGFNHGVNLNEDAIFSLLIEKLGKVKILDDVTVEMDGRRFNKGFLAGIREWTKGFGLNSIYIQINYLLTGEIRTYRADFADYRSASFGKGETEQIAVIIPIGNHQKKIAATLTCLEDQEYEHRFKVYALDNFCVDQSLNIARLFTEVEVVKFPTAYTLGEKLDLLCQQISAPVVAIVGPNVEVETDWLQQIFNYFNKHQGENTVVTAPLINSNSDLITKVTQQPIASITSKLELYNCALPLGLARKVFTGKVSEESLLEHIAGQKPEIEINPLLKAYVDGPTTGDKIRNTLKKLAGF